MAFFLGHHWGFRRESGEPQLTFNYVGALSRWLTNFCFSKGVHFTTEKKTEHIVPALLKRIWETDNDKPRLLLEIGEMGGVNGDAFIKVAYEEKWKDRTGFRHPGRVRILALNPSFCFPEYHPHDPERLIRFKLKYRFWGTSTEGTRAVFTYTEIITDEDVEEYINDELIDRRANALGTIPVVHIPNIPVPGSPWGLSDITNIIALNREYNEQATNIADIVNYHAAPVTIITGGKASNLEMGANKIWGGLPKDAKVSTLENGVDLSGPLEYLQLLKTSMHEMVGVPESALGQAQAISNTSGVALSMGYECAMLPYNYKTIQYGAGARKTNALALRTLWIYEPETLAYDAETAGAKTDPDQQADTIDPTDPESYRTACEWPPPLPVDVLVLLNEIQSKMAIGLMSKRGALRALGEEFPADVLREIFDENLDEATFQGALDMLKMQISSAIFTETGLYPPGIEPPPPQPGPADGDPTAVGAMPGLPGITAGNEADIEALQKRLVALGAGTKLAQRRNPENNVTDQET